jgi:hypothetical protein
VRAFDIAVGQDEIELMISGNEDTIQNVLGRSPLLYRTVDISAGSNEDDDIQGIHDMTVYKVILIADVKVVASKFQILEVF